MTERGARFSRGAWLGIAVATALCLCAFLAASAGAAERLVLTIDNAWVMQPASEEDGNIGNHLLATDEPPIEMSGDLAPDGSVTIPASEFTLPPIVTSAPASGRSTFRAAEDATGVYDRASGEVSLRVPMNYTLRATMSEAPPPFPPEVNCVISGFTSNLVTEGELSIVGEFSSEGEVTPNEMTFQGSPFAGSQAGALLGGWIQTAAGLTAKGIDGTSDVMCAQLLTTLPGGVFAGFLWLHGTAEVVDVPECPPGQLGTPPNCSAPPPPATCPAGETGTPPDCVPARPIKTLALTPKKARLKAGKALRLRLRIQNDTETAARITVGLKSGNRRVRVPKRKTVTVPAESTLISIVKAKATKKATGKARITARAFGLKASSTLTVKKAKPRRR